LDKETSVANLRSQAHGGGSALRAKTLRHSDREQWPVLLAHDLKTPLSAISINVDFALAELADGMPDSVRAALADCKEANARALRLVQDMADGLRLASGDLKATLADVAIAPIVERAVAATGTDAAARGLHILWTSGGEVVRADSCLLERSLERLLERAVRNTCGHSISVDQRGGTVTIRADTSIDGDADPAERALATHFAETAIRAQGGHFRVEVNAGSLVYRVKLPARAITL
jgi:K+-sensing histidine kinase KdpD